MTLSTASNGDVKGEEVQQKLTERVQETCPYVGLPDDPETWLAFAAEGNCCHYAQPAWPIDPDHQEAFCLSEGYVACPMLEEPEDTPLLPDLRAGDGGERSRGRTLLLVAVGTFLLAGALFAGGRLLDQARGASSSAPAAGVVAETTAIPSSTPSATSPPATATHEPAALLVVGEMTLTSTTTPSPTATATATSTSTPTETPATLTIGATPSPTATATATPVAAAATVDVETLNVRNGPGIDYAVVGQVAQGDSLTIIGRNNSGGWWQICCVAGDEGWIYGETVIAEGNTETIPIVPAPPLAIPTATP